MRSRAPRGRGGAGGTGLRAAALVVAAGVILGAWWLLSLVVDSPVLPGPLAVLVRMVEIGPRILLRHAGASLGRVAAALVVATAAALPLGLVMGRSRRIDRLLAPIAYLLYPVPKIALLPIVFLLVGIGDAARITVVVLVLFFQILVAVRDAARSIPSAYLVSFASIGGTRLQSLRFVLLPAILPELLTALRLGTGTALAVLFFAETFFTNYGLGTFIVESWMRVSYPDMMAGIVSIGLLGLLLFVALDLVEHFVCWWKHRSTR
ncbi:MAG: ABC transporter permease subunit [Spirochaetaceae bacterium]|nr:MAG: ABC transporter permease subunit [Spirochaetaceae bacterium]